MDGDGAAFRKDEVHPLAAFGRELKADSIADSFCSKRSDDPGEQSVGVRSRAARRNF